MPKKVSKIVDMQPFNVHRHPHRSVGAQPKRASLPKNGADRTYILWRRERLSAERVVENLDIHDLLLFNDLVKASTTPLADDLLRRQQQIAYHESVKQRVVKRTGLHAVQFQSIEQVFESFMGWLMTRYPTLNWEAVVNTFYREPQCPERSGNAITGAWSWSDPQELLLFLRIDADLKNIRGRGTDCDPLSLVDDDQRPGLLAELEKVRQQYDFEPVEASKQNLPLLRDRASFYTEAIEALASHSELFDSAVHGYDPDERLTAELNISMNELLIAEDYYETQIEQLSGVKSPETPPVEATPPRSAPESSLKAPVHPQQATESLLPPVSHDPEQLVQNGVRTPQNGSEEPRRPVYAEKVEPPEKYDWEKPYWDRKQVAAFLGVKSADTISKWVKAGKIPATTNPSGKYIFSAVEMKQWAKDQQKRRTLTSGADPEWREDFPFSF